MQLGFASGSYVNVGFGISLTMLFGLSREARLSVDMNNFVSNIVAVELCL